ncbi:MAG: hypothetical protein D6B27_05525 [Gammaproteobacteria bacterium]|nr:MAG: hypothetical protein D6B27_05525 [Gammaproteobacteria bacterium]
MKKNLFAIAILIAASISMAEDNVDIITNNKADINAISSDDLKAIYFGKRQTTKEGLVVTPYDSDNDSKRNKFYKKYFRRTPLQVHRYWARKIFAGEGVLPPKRIDEEQLVEILEQTINSIGYTDLSLEPKDKDDIKVLEVADD